MLISCEAPVRADLAHLEVVDLRAMVQEDSTVRSYRSRIRYLVALWPEKTLPQLAETISTVVGGFQLSLSDIRMILEGRQLDDPSKLTGEVPYEAIQTVGRVLADGGTMRDAAQASRLSIDTVERIDEYLGLTEAVHERRMDTAVIAVREGWTVTKTAAVAGVSRSTAHRYMQHARAVLRELEEL